MFRLRDISIRNKLILMQVFTSLLVLTVVFVVFIYTDIKSYKQLKIDSVLSLAEVVGTNSISTIQFQDSQAASKILIELHNVAPEIVHAVIMNDKEEIFASYSKPGAPAFKIPEILKQQNYTLKDNQLFVSSLIQTKNEVIGKVYLQVHLSELKLIKDFKYKLATVLLLFALIFSSLIAVVIQSYISKPLLRLVNVMKNVAKTGDYNNKISGKGKDEIATLMQVFNKLMQQINENIKKKDEFIGIASHELKTPLTSIKGYIEMLYAMEDQQPKKQFIEKANENLGKLERLIKDLLDVSKIQSGQLQLQMNEFNISSLLRETIDEVQMIAPSHKIVLSDKLEPLTIFADRQRIEQVLINLLSNAVKYSPGQKKIVVDCEKNQNELIIKIRDFGIGVPPDEHDKIFERFYRTKDLSIHISGFGLGLYICRDIITRHNGKIWIVDAEKGSVFNFSLPLKPSFITQQTEP